jgi:hypothetical protein
MGGFYIRNPNILTKKNFGGGEGIECENKNKKA